MKKARVVVGLSGGIDSSVAALLLLEKGYEVIGVTMSIWDGEYRPTGKHACYGPDEEEEIREAGKVAAILGIPHYVYNCSAEYKSSVLEYFRSEYLAGRTPNPCIQCNKLIKFGLLPESVRKEGISFDFFATGHYARVEENHTTKRFFLKKGLDPKKDQSYFLYRLTQEQLSTLLLPLGEYSKKEIMAKGRKTGIMIHEYEESQDFYSGDYKEILDVREMPGDIINSSGKVLGHHKGIWNYTIGQRKGIGIAFHEPLYVVALQRETNRVVVGTRSEIVQSEFKVRDLNWISESGLIEDMKVSVKIRSAQDEKEAMISPLGTQEVKVTYLCPDDAVTPGQSAVFYQGDVVVGGGIIQ